MSGFRTVWLSGFKKTSEPKGRDLAGNAPSAMPHQLPAQDIERMPRQPMNVGEMPHAQELIVQQTIANVPNVMPHMLRLKDAEVTRACAHKTLPVRKPALTTALVAEAEKVAVTCKVTGHQIAGAKHHALSKEALSGTALPGCKEVDKVHAGMVHCSFAKTTPDPAHVRPLAPEVHADKHSAPCRQAVSARCSEEP